MKKLFNFFITFIHPYSCILMIFFVVATLMLSSDLINAVKDDVPLENYLETKIYHNVNVTVEKEKISGKLNQYIQTKNMNDRCYVEYCGFPQAGNFQLSSIEFIHVDRGHVDRVTFLNKSCLDAEEKHCFRNISEAYIEQATKQARQKHERGGILWLIYSASALIFLFLLGRKYRLPDEYKI